MKAVVYTGYGLAPTLADADEPRCSPGGVVLTVAATGLCRSDWHAWQGRELVPLPHIPGHELAGVVAEVGADVSRWRVGDRVTVPFVCGCGACEYCLAGDAQVCPWQTQPGFTGPGSFAERVAIHAADLNLVRLPDSVDFVSAACLGCRFATAFRALTVHGRPRPGDWLAVYGCGGVGMSAVMIGMALGARVVAVDVSAAVLDRASELGAQAVVNAGEHPDPVAAVVELTGGGAQVSMDALGSAATALSSVCCLRRRGRHLQVGLLHGAQRTPPIPMDQVIAQELEIYGSHGMAAHGYPAMLELVANRTLRPDLLVGQVIGLPAAAAALAGLGEAPPAAGMTVIEPG